MHSVKTVIYVHWRVQFCITGTTKHYNHKIVSLVVLNCQKNDHEE